MLARNTAVVAMIAIAVTGSAAAQTKVDWPTYGFDTLHSGHNSKESLIGQRDVAKLSLAWSFSAGGFEVTIDPSINQSMARFQAQPVLAANVATAGGTTDLVLAGDDNGYFFALDALSSNPAGSVVWYQSLGTRSLSNCGGAPRTVGIRSSAAVDRAANNGKGAVYVAANGLVHALDLATGAELSGWPVTVPTPMNVPTEGFIHDSPTVVNGQLYFGTSSCSDTPPYWGRVVDIDTTSATVRNLWYSLTGNASPPVGSGGGIWGWGGVAVDPKATAGGVYVATGNARTGANQQVYAEYLVDLSPNLSQTVGVAGPAIPSGDNDYGSTPVVFQPSACGSKLVAALNKTGLLVVAAIQSSGALKLMQSLPIMLQANGELIGNVAWDSQAQLLLVSTKADGPKPYVHGLTAFHIDAACATPLVFAWQTTKNQSGQPLMTSGTRISSPTIANRLAFFGTGGSSAAVFAVATTTTTHGSAGQVLWQSPILGCTANWAPTVVNGRVFVACEGNHSVLDAFAVPGS